MYHNSIHDIKSSRGYGGHLEFRDTACVFGYFFFYGPKELLYQRGPLHHDLK